MNPYLLVFVGIDMALLGYILLKLRRDPANIDLLRDLTEERRILSDLHAQIKEELTQGQAQAQAKRKEILTVAAEIERDARSGKETISSHLNAVFADFSDKIEGPVVELTRKHHQLEDALRRVTSEKERLLKAMSKAEKLVGFFRSDLPYEDLLKDIEHKKYDDARRLLAQGCTLDQVALETGMRPGEIEILASMARSNHPR